MDFSKTGLMQAMVSKMGWLTERQKILAQNIAHADTPGFTPQDVAPFSFRGELKHAMTGAAVTQPGHIRTAPETASGVDIIKKRPSAVSPNGNGVSVEEEMMQVSTTAIDYQMVTNLIRKWQGMLRTVLGRGGGV